MLSAAGRLPFGFYGRLPSIKKGGQAWAPPGPTPRWSAQPESRRRCGKKRQACQQQIARDAITIPLRMQCHALFSNGGRIVRRRAAGQTAKWIPPRCDWFACSPKRAHQARILFPGEADEDAARTPAGCQLIVLVRQVEPGSWLRAAVCINAKLLPLPDDEAVVHALVEVAAPREAAPPDRQALWALVDKHTARGRQANA
jgi:hypothetical protein